MTSNDELLKLLERLEDEANSYWKHAPAYFRNDEASGWGAGVAYSIDEIRKVVGE